jgi:hypothetical protein
MIEVQRDDCIQDAPEQLCGLMKVYMNHILKTIGVVIQDYK